jgi:hypothetical protein
MQGRHNCIFDVKERLQNDNKESILDFKQNISYILRNNYLPICDYKNDMKSKEEKI